MHRIIAADSKLGLLASTPFLMLALLSVCTIAFIGFAPVASADEWLIEPVETQGSTGEYTSIAIDQSNYPHIAYYNNTEGGLKHAWWNGTSWQREMVDAGDNVGWWTSIRIDSQDRPQISYCRVGDRRRGYRSRVSPPRPFRAGSQSRRPYPVSSLPSSNRA
ncbi:MAG: hypothetical protein GF330_12630 [Candidatus Eisenbacteria bacterium]|nr:hypothetical protein [Candidatus Eisenbacteria bacterium]